MNGLDCLREEMASRGLTQAQIESKTAAVVLDILSESGDKYKKTWETEQEITKRAREAERKILTIRSQQNFLESQENELNHKREAFEAYNDEVKKYINDFNKSLEECETQEGRDRMRIAQMFVNSVDIDTKYDNTAFIIGLSAILSGGKINAIKELKKINSKLPSPFEEVIRI